MVRYVAYNLLATLIGRIANPTAGDSADTPSDDSEDGDKDGQDEFDESADVEGAQLPIQKWRKSGTSPISATQRWPPIVDVITMRAAAAVTNAY